MSLDTLVEIMHDTERRVVAAGVPAITAATVLIHAEAAFVNALNESARAERQLVLELREQGTKELARKHGKSPRTIRRWKMRAFNKIGHLRRSPCPSR